MLAGTSIETAYRRLIASRLLEPLRRAGVTPDQLTVAGLLLSVLAGAAAPWAPIAAGLVLLAAGLLDTLDGSLARVTNQASRAGAFLDSTLDRWAEFCVLFGCWARLARLDLAVWGGALVLLAVQGSLMVSYARARAEGLGHNLRGGIFERAERLLLVALGLLLTPWERLVGLAPGGMLLWTLAILAAGANLTAADRILRGRRTLSREQK
jgi:phosphatidylglycerophosphate synthase